jgi:hypothetical protein
MVEEADPGKWWVPEEVGRGVQMDDKPCCVTRHKGRSNKGPIFKKR